ncbi:MAG: 1,4-dihydroxy-2-naphthoate polyprenyltransferase [Verrucomicrobiota bacterium]
MNAWVQAARPKTLPAAVVPVALGAALAQAHDTFVLWPVAICLAFALLIQVGTNFANDYYDFRSGADTDARIGPARAVASGWITPEAMRRATGVTFVLAFAVGCLLVPYGGWGLVAIGGLSILCGIAYTGGPYPLGYNGLGDVFVFLFFGLIATGFTYYVQAGTIPIAAWLLGCIPGALATNLLVVNNLRDVETDRVVGKRTTVVRFGVRFGLAEYGAMLALALAVSVWLAWHFDDLALLLPWLLAAWGWHLTVLLARAQGRSAGYWGRLLAQTAAFLIAFGALQIVGLLLA